MDQWSKYNKEAKTIKLLEDNTGVNLHDLKFGKGSLNIKTEVKATKDKEAKLDFTKKNFFNLCIKGHYLKSGEKLENGRKFFQIVYLIKGLIPKHIKKKNSYIPTTKNKQPI